jgi:predicted  nucleic acid-binding Zn-ribbon protein
MNANSLLDILSFPHQTDEELAILLVKSAGSASSKSLEDAFTIALGVGKLSNLAAQNLIAILERLASISSLEKYELLDEAELAALREEVRELLGRQHRLRDEQQAISELQDKVLELKGKLEEASLKKSRLEGELKELQEQLDWIDKKESELQK